MKRIARLFAVVLMLLGAMLAAVPGRALAATYPTASEVYVSGQPMSDYTGNHASYDASTGTLTLTNQVNGVSVQSDRSNLDLNIVVDGARVSVYATSRQDYLVPHLYGIANETGGNIHIYLTAGTKLSVTAVTTDDAVDNNASVTGVAGIYCRGSVTLTGAEGSEYSIFARSNWYVNGQIQNKPNLRTMGIYATGGVSIGGDASGKVSLQNRGIAASPQYCSSAISMASGSQINISATGNWEFDSSACGNPNYPNSYAALFYVSAGGALPNVAPSAGVVTFKPGGGSYQYFVLNSSGNSRKMSDLPEVNYHALSISSYGCEYKKDSREVIDTTTIKLNELPALGTRGSITAENTELDLGQSDPRYTMRSGHWWYKDSDSDTWHMLGQNQYLPADATAVRVGFELEAAEGYRFSNSTDVIVRFNTSTSTVVRHTTERKYMHPENIPSQGTFYIDLALSDIADQHPIDQVKVWSVRAPHYRDQAYVVTSQSSSYGQIPDSAFRYYAWATPEQCATRPGNQYWTEVDPSSGNDIRTLEAGEAFQAGHQYRWHGILYAKPGWKFTSNTVIAFNSDNVCGSAIYADGKLLEVYRTWTCPTMLISKVEVLDQTEPVAGETPVIDGAVPDDAAYSITAGESYWYEGRLNTSNSSELRSLAPFTGTFQADTWYSYVVCLEPDRANGYGFGYGSTGYANDQNITSMTASVNGSSSGDVFGHYFTAGQTAGRGKIFLCRTFYCTNPDAIERIDIQQTMPVAGQTALGDATSLTPDVTLSVDSEFLAFFAELGVDTSRVPSDATSLWIGELLIGENEDINPNALMPVFENSEAGIDRTYQLRIQAHAQNGRVFAMGSNGVAATQVFVCGVPASVSLSEDRTEATITLYYTMPWADDTSHQLFVPKGVVLERATEDGSWMQWSPSEADYMYTGFDLYSTAEEGMRFRVRATSWPSKWQAPGGEEFYQWYCSSSDVEFERSVRSDYNEFTMPAHDTTIGILTQKKGTLPTELTDWMINGYTASDGWENPESWNSSDFNGSDQWREAVLFDDKDTTETEDDYTMVKGTDYTVTYEPAVGADVGTYIVTYTGIPGPGNVGGYEGSITTTYKINSVNIANCDITVNTSHADDPENPGDDPTWWEYYTGSAIEPKVTVTLGDYTLVEGVDYELEYYWNTDVGSASVHVNATGGNFSGWTSRPFEIRARDFSEVTITPPSDVTYTNDWQYPPVTVAFEGATLEEGVDYYTEYYANYNVGTAKVVVTGNKYAGWDGMQEFEFKILPIDLSDPTIEWDDLYPHYYTGNEFRYFDSYTHAGNHPIAGGLYRDHDFEVTSYSDNVYPGMATITIAGKGNYTGTHELHFDIRAYLQNDYISITGMQDIYQLEAPGQPVEPKPTVTIINNTYGDRVLTEGVDYKLEYESNVTPGSMGFVHVRSIDERFYLEGRTLTFAIEPIDISAATIEPIPDQAYGGGYIQPDITVTYGGAELEEGVDYTVEFFNNIEPGTATVRVTGYGNFGGTLETTFQIKDGVPMYRLYNRWSYEHFYTSDIEERDNLVAVGWKNEGVGWWAPHEGDPVYRLYNPWAPGGDHHYTMDLEEYEYLCSVGWSGEGVGWFSDPAQTVPVYREYNPWEFAHNHNYTADKTEHDFLITVGWNDEGIGWYGV